jgi:photosystem II stability/assembly factor-like uncharacterized protein
MTWQTASDGLATTYVRWLAYDPDVSDREFAGTEPAGIFVSHDGARSWRGCPEVEALRDAHRWFLPYSPRAGCVRGFAFHGNRAYAAVEVGGVLRSDDGGQTWQLVTGSTGNPSLDEPPQPLVYPDVHSIAAHPSSPDLVFAPTGAGFYLSEDGGATWKRLYECYCRAAWVDQGDPQHVILGPADGVERNGRIEETRDGGQTWHPAAGGLDVPWRRHLVERFTQVAGDLVAVLSNGEAWTAPLASLAWRPLLPGVRGVTAVAWLPE